MTLRNSQTKQINNSTHMSVIQSRNLFDMLVNIMFIGSPSVSETLMFHEGGDPYQIIDRLCLPSLTVCWDDTRELMGIHVLRLRYLCTKRKFRYTRTYPSTYDNSTFSIRKFLRVGVEMTIITLQCAKTTMMVYCELSLFLLKND